MRGSDVSVIIPTYNRASSIRRAVESVLNQSTQVGEVIVVDDGSTDDTEQIFTSIADVRVKYIKLNEKVGGGGARNAGAAASTGSLVAFLDSDDLWLSTKIEEQLRALSCAPQSVAVFTGIRYCFPDRIVDTLAPANISTSRLLQRNIIGSTSTALIYRNVFNLVGGFDASLPSCQDWDLWLRLRPHGDFAVVRQPLVVYYSDSSNRISGDRSKVLAGHTMVFKRCLAELSGRDLKVASAHHQLRLAEILYFDFGDSTAAFVSSAKSLRHSITLRALIIFARSVGSAAIFSKTRKAKRAKKSPV